MDFGWYLKRQCWKVLPGRQDLAHGGSGSPLKSPALGALGSAAAPEKGERGRLYPKQSVSKPQTMGASLALCDRLQGTPGGNSHPPSPVCCRHLPSAGARMAVSCVPPQQRVLGQPCFPPHSVLSLLLSRNPRLRVSRCSICSTSARCRRPKPAAQEAAGWGRSPCQKPTPLPGFCVSGRDPSRAHGTWAMGPCQGELLLSHWGLEHP